MRLLRVFAGQYKHVVGLSFAAPTEYLGMVGLAEAVLYSMRMYDVVLRSAITIVPPEAEEDIMNHLKLNTERIEFVVAVLAGGYDSDPLMRGLPDWMRLLEDSSISAHTAVAQIFGSTSETYNYCDATPDSPQLRELVPSFLGTEAALDMAEGIAVPHLYALSNGVQMPVMGLGTWQLDGKVCQDAVTAAIIAGYRLVFCFILFVGNLAPLLIGS